MFRHLSVLIFFICISGIVSAQAIWTDVAEPQIVQKGERRIVPQVYRTVHLDVQQLTPLLHAAPERFTPDAAKQQDLPVLTIPMPDGSKSRFRLTESPVMAPGLAITGSCIAIASSTLFWMPRAMRSGRAAACACAR